MVIYLQRGADCLHIVQLMPLHAKAPSSLASFKSRLALPFWYRLTQVVLEKRPLNGWVCVCVYIYILTDDMLCCAYSGQCSVNIGGQCAEAVTVWRTNSHKCHIKLLQTTLKQKRYFTQKYWNEVTTALVDSPATVVSNEDRIWPKNICNHLQWHLKSSILQAKFWYYLFLFTDPVTLEFSAWFYESLPKLFPTVPMCEWLTVC